MPTRAAGWLRSLGALAVLLSALPAAADVLPAPGVPSIEEATARAIAQRLTTLPITGARLVTRGGTLAWYVAPRAIGMTSAPVIVVDATTGRVLEARDRVHRASALTYAENPVRSPVPTLLPLPATSTAIDARSCVDHGARVSLSLDGVAYPIRTCALESVAMPDGSGNYTALPRARPAPVRDEADPFAETSARFHAASLLAFLGALDGAAPLPETPLAIIAGVRIAPGLLAGDYTSAGDLAPFAQSFYLPGAGTDEGAAFRSLYGTTASAVWLGQGTNADLAYDGDVVAHETTHAVVDATLHVGGWRLREDGISDEPEALNEALADYFAAALANDPVLGEYAAEESPATIALLRSLADDATCNTIDGEPHDDSAVVAGALWRTRATLADPAALDRAVYRAMKLGPGARDLGFAGFASLLATTLPDAAAAIFQAEVARRALPCTVVLPLAPDVPLRGVRRAYAAPGTLAAGTAIAPGILQLRVDLPADPVAVRVVFTGQSIVTSPLFGRGGTPFHPVVLAGWDHALRWTYAGGIASDADATVAADGAASYVALFMPPAGTRTLFLQIANDGESDGTYDAITVSLAAPDASADAGTEDASADAAVPARTELRAGGSGCALGASPRNDAAPFVLVVLFFWRRRQNTRAEDRRSDPPPSRAQRLTAGRSRGVGSRGCSTGCR